MGRERLHHGTAAIHWNEAAPISPILSGAYPVACGVDSVNFDRFVSREWPRVTCKRCLRHKARLARFARHPASVDEARDATAE